MKEEKEREYVEQELKKHRRNRKIVITLIVLLSLMILGCGFKFVKLKFYMSGQMVLGEARIIRIGIQDLKYDYYAKNKKMLDFTTESGLKDSIYKELQELHEFNGELQILQWDKNGLDVKRLRYTEGNFTAEYTADNKEADNWQVYYNWKM